ncbi:MAG: hypothetical protein M5R41_16965 [Bacteroidia bacterium]|nr:hypothetical protein [Bacteroidia bacterium]
MFEHTFRPKPDKADITMHNATTMFQVGAYRASLPLFEELLRLDPLDFRVRYYLALSYFREGWYDCATEVYNSLAGINDPEAQLACQLLSRAFLLREGNALDDVRMLTMEEAVAIREEMRLSPLLPQAFAQMVWYGRNDLGDPISIDPAIILGPGKQFLCALPWEQTPYEQVERYDWLPVWTCSQQAFDRQVAMHLFFQRALQFMRDEYHLDWPPVYTFAIFPSRQRMLLLRRVYPDAPFTEIFDEV